MKKYYYFIICVLMGSSLTLRAQNKSEIDENLKKVNAFFEKKFTENTGGVALAVVKNGEIVFQNGYGMANLEYDIPITPNTVFHAASISKQFTAYAILLLEKEGKLRQGKPNIFLC